MKLLRGGRREVLYNTLALLILTLIISSLFSVQGKAQSKSCSMCHNDVATAYTGSVHGQAELGCATCHETGLHGQAMTDKRSLKICGTCHTQLTEHWQSSTHAGVGLGCVSCHSIHSPARGRELMLLKTGEDQLCYDCHELNKDIHAGILDPKSIEKKSCIICHNPHGGEVGLLTAKLGGEKWDLNKEYNHFPVAQGRCKDCHSPHLVSFGSGGDEEYDDWDLAEEESSGFSGQKQGLLKVSGSDLCFQCHVTQKEHFAETGHAKVENIASDGEKTPCLGCHLPHASDYSALTKLPGDELCVACHSGYTPHHFLSFGSVEQGKLKCVECHEPHGTPGYRRLLVKNNICSMCHSK